MTIEQAVMGLSIEQVQKLQAMIIEAGLREELHGDSHKRFFKRLRRTSKGKLRICYAAICTATNEEFSRVCGRLVEGI
jgi:hypothetical protein